MVLDLCRESDRFIDVEDLGRFGQLQSRQFSVPFDPSENHLNANDRWNRNDVDCGLKDAGVRIRQGDDVQGGLGNLSKARPCAREAADDGRRIGGAPAARRPGRIDRTRGRLHAPCQSGPKVRPWGKVELLGDAEARRNGKHPDGVEGYPGNDQFAVEARNDGAGLKRHNTRRRACRAVLLIQGRRAGPTERREANRRIVVIARRAYGVNCARLRTRTKEQRALGGARNTLGGKLRPEIIFGLRNADGPAPVAVRDKNRQKGRPTRINRRSCDVLRSRGRYARAGKQRDGHRIKP